MEGSDLWWRGAVLGGGQRSVWGRWLLSLRAEVEDGGERELGYLERELGYHDIGYSASRAVETHILRPAVRLALTFDLEAEARRARRHSQEMEPRLDEFSAVHWRIPRIGRKLGESVHH